MKKGIEGKNTCLFVCHGGGRVGGRRSDTSPYLKEWQWKYHSHSHSHDHFAKISYHVSMESRKRSKKQQILDKFTAYVESNPNTSYDDVAEAMRRSPKTIYRWCKELGIRLSTLKANDRLGTTLPSTTKEEEDLDELDGIIDKVEREIAYIQKRIDELQNQIADDDRRIQENAGHRG